MAESAILLCLSDLMFVLKSLRQCDLLTKRLGGSNGAILWIETE